MQYQDCVDFVSLVDDRAGTTIGTFCSTNVGTVSFSFSNQLRIAQKRTAPANGGGWRAGCAGICAATGL